jgi:DNA-directed RNA polymerase specialized sigma24 family protein
MESPTPADPAALAAALDRAEARARRYGPGELGEFARDQAADAVLWAWRRHAADPAAFRRVAAAAAGRAVRRAVAYHLRRKARRPLVLSYHSTHALDRYAGTARDEPGAGGDAAADTLEPAAPPAPDPAFAAGVAGLPGDERAAVVLHVLHGYSVTDTGLLLGTGEMGALRRLRRAYRRLAG